MERRLVALLACALALSGCASFSKQCFASGVCRIEENGAVRWEGPPEKVAELQAAEEAQKRAAAERDQEFAQAERRPPSEPIRVAIVGPSTSSSGLQMLLPQYQVMLVQALGGDPRIQLVDTSRIASLLAEKDPMGFGRQAAPKGLDAAMARRVRDGSGEVDVLVVVTLAEKQRTGMVSGGGGSGVAQVLNVEFTAHVSSVYAFNPASRSEVGKSNTGIALAGIDKSAKAQRAELKGARNPESDRGAVNELADWVKATVTGPLAGQLPSLAAVQAINQKLSATRAAQLRGALEQQAP
jgi:hypothetical protein